MILRCVDALQALLVSAVSQLLDSEQTVGRSQSGSEVDNFLLLDPLLEVGKSQASSSRGQAQEAIVFVVGGGNYLERERIHQWAQACSPKRNILYGATELLTGAQFASQIAELGRRRRAT
jgi:sec1 family domain-containing protein 1